MRPQIKQRWMYVDSADKHIAEIENISGNDVIVKVVQILPGSRGYTLTGSIRKSPGLSAILAGTTNEWSSYWTYLDGQESP